MEQLTNVIIKKRRRIMKIFIPTLLMVIFAFQISFAQNINRETKTSLKQVRKNNLANIKNYPKVIALKPKRSFDEVLLEWQKTSNNETYKRLIAENIKHRLQFLEQKSNSFDESKIHELKNIIEKEDYINNDNLAVKALIEIANIEGDYLDKKLVTKKELLYNNSIKKNDMLILLKEHDGVINYIHSRIYEKEGESWYKEGASPGSGNAWPTDIKVTNTGTETTDYFLLMDPKRRTFWLGFILA